MLDGIQSHIDAVAAGETVESRLALIAGSNSLGVEAKRTQSYFLKAFCLAAALEPICGTAVELDRGLMIELRKPRHLLEGNELPGARADSEGWLVVEGAFSRDGKRCADFQWDKQKGLIPLWPLMLRDPPVRGPGPFENFRPQALELLRQAGEQWPQRT